MIRLLALALFLTGHAVAQTPTAASCADPACRAFDFWLGEGLVDDPAGTRQGENSVTAEVGGCLILERWTSASGGSGQSDNFFDPGLRQWRQVWVSRAAVIDYAGGLNKAGGMELEGTIHSRDGRSAGVGRYSPTGPSASRSRSSIWPGRHGPAGSPGSIAASPDAAADSPVPGNARVFASDPKNVSGEALETRGRVRLIAVGRNRHRDGRPYSDP